MHIIVHFSNESRRTLTVTTCHFFFFFFFGGGGGGDDGVVNVGYFLPLLIGFHHLPKVHVNKPEDQQNSNFTRASRFLYISFPSSHDCDILKKTPRLVKDRGTRDKDFLFRFLTVRNSLF